MRHLRELGIFIVLLVVCGLLLLSVYMEVESTTISQLNSEQMVHAGQAAKSIERFFSTYNNTLSFLADNNHIISMDPEGRVLMQEFFHRHSQDIASITRVDRNGTILYTYPYETSTGANISSQSHVRKSMSSHQVVISDVFTAVQGFRTVALAVPVFKDGTYDGSLSILIPFEQLTQKDLESVRILDTGYAWAVSEKGTILYTPDSGLVDQSAFTVYNRSPAAVAFVSEAVKGNRGSSSYTLEPAQAGKDSHERYQAVYFPVMIGDTHWSIIVATPEREILSTLQGFRNNLVIISGLLVILLFFTAYYTTRAWGILKEEEKRRVAEAALRESERNYRTILETIQEIFIRTDINGNLIMASPSTLGVLGYDSPDEIVGKPIAGTLYYQPEKRDELLRLLSEKGHLEDYEVQFRRKDRSLIWVSAHCHYYLGPDGKIAGIEGTFRDISERKRTREELLKKSEELVATYQQMTATADELKENYDELQKSQQALEQARKKLNLLNTITFQDIQNALFSLEGYIELLSELSLAGNAGTYIKKERGVAEKISNMLVFAKNYQDMGINPPRWQNINQVFLLAISHLELVGISRKINLDNLELYADTLLETVFFNLVENAIRHGKTVTEISLHYRETADHLILCVEDNGAGIPDSDKEKIFERGYGAQKGMGLFLVREVFGITNISISETGTYGKGARFEIIVPKGVYRLDEKYTPQ
ncbi:cache domain-containing protein [uncultured Methanoregula sp.]|uniref:cache domain-containing protein n=1 Tax=uncultured Methanoregula sp. TaxID=1005933 RepID=UPI002AAB662E|nr:cache domain-containing protein [uncultured Methanoregula sp.]